MLDRTSKLLLALIAIGLWLNAGSSLLRPAPASAQSDQILTTLQIVPQSVGCETTFAVAVGDGARPAEASRSTKYSRCRVHFTQTRYFNVSSISYSPDGRLNSRISVVLVLARFSRA